MGAIQMMSRVDVAGDGEEEDENGETAVPQQLSLIGEADSKPAPTKKSIKREKS
jgi:hypothetical protein